MDTTLPLRPAGFAAVIAGAPTASSALFLGPPNCPTGDLTVVIDNSLGTSRAWIGYGASSSAAQTNAATVVNAGVTTTPGVLMVAKGTVQSFSLQSGIYLSAIMELGSCSIGVMVGTGT